MTYDRSTHAFQITFEPPQEEVFYAADAKWLELFVRKAKIKEIPYGAANHADDKKIKVDQLVPVLRLPMEYIPDPRVVKEDAHDHEQQERDMKERAERMEEERLIRLAQQAAKQEEKAKKREAMLAEREKKKDGDDDDEDDSGEDESGSEKSGSRSGVSGAKSSQRKSKSGSLGQSASKGGKSFVGSDEDYSDDGPQDDGEGSDEDYDGGIGDLPSQPAMKRELIQAIEDERREYQELKKLNEECQRKIILMDHNNRDYEKQTDQMLHEHKYLNTLANVHQVRYNLKETQDRYNRMAGELQNKLNEKQTKCTEIEQQFKELKRSVAMNAVHSRTGKKLSAKVIKEWEEADEAKDQEVHQYRLQNIALRNRLANQEKVLKKKEQLAEGLHLIDYEQLKIENQTLNEKIEERNEELTRLRGKIINHVIMLSHTREKMKFIETQNGRNEKELAELVDKLDETKTKLTKAKNERAKLDKQNQKLSQKTGIARDNSLKVAYENRKTEF